MIILDKPGIYYDIAPADYLADPCPDASLNASTAKLLVEKSPRHAWHAHPRLNTKREPTNDTRFDLPNVAHALLLGRGKEYVNAPFDSWKSKAAREFRELHRLEGRIAILDKYLDQARAMVNAAQEQLSEMGCAAFGVGGLAGASEVVVVAGGVEFWYRCMIDWMAEDGSICYDYKTTQGSASPSALEYKMVEDGWDIQAAMQESCLNMVAPGHLAGYRRWRFVLQETLPPFALTLAELPETVMAMGRKKLYLADEKWKICMRTGQWPSYSTGVVKPHYPTFKLQQWEDREADDGRDDEDQFRPDGAV